MKNEALLKNLCFVFVTLTTIALIGCGGDSGGSKASTKACPSNAYYNHADGEWYRSRNDLTICNPLPDVQPQGCDIGEVVVRSPFSYDVNYDPRYASDLKHTNSNYHYTNGSYREICMSIGGAGWGHVSYGGYYYVNLGLLNASLNTNIGVRYTTTYTPIIHSSNTNNTAAALLTLGVLAALFLAN